VPNSSSCPELKGVQTSATSELGLPLERSDLAAQRLGLSLRGAGPVLLPAPCALVFVAVSSRLRRQNHPAVAGASNQGLTASHSHQRTMELSSCSLRALALGAQPNFLGSLDFAKKALLHEGTVQMI
jgi:hypothetical protein